VIVFLNGVVLVKKVTEYDVRCDIALSRAWRIADSVVLYALSRRICFITDTMLMNEIAAMTMTSAITTIISIKLKPLARYLAFLFRLLISIFP
jgi:hypothetical protein